MLMAYEHACENGACAGNRAWPALLPYVSLKGPTAGLQGIRLLDAGPPRQACSEASAGSEAHAQQHEQEPS